MTDNVDIVVRTRGTAAARKNINEIGDASNRSAGLVNNLKKALTGFAVGAALTAATRNALKFNTAIAEVSTLVDTATFNMRSLEAATLEQSAAFGSFPARQAEAAYQIISAGAGTAAEALETLDAANRLAVGGVTDVLVAADGLTSVLNAYGDAVDSAADVSDTLFVGVRAGKTTVEELSASLGKVAPLASNANVEFTELVAAVAALTKGGISTREAVTGTRAILASVVKPTQEASEAAKRLGIDFSAAGLEAKGFEGFLSDLVDKTGGSTDELAKLFGGVEALVPVLALSGQAGEDFADILKEMEDRGGATADAFNKIANSPGFQLDRTFAAINAEFTKTVNGLLNALVPAIRFLADNMNTLFDVLKVVGTFLGVRFATVFIPAAITAIRGFATATLTAFATNPITAFAAAVTVVASLFISQSDKIKLSAESQATAFDLIIALVQQLGTVVGETFGFFGRLLTGTQVDLDALNIEGFVRDFGRGMDIIFANARGAFVAIETFITNILASLGEKVASFFNGAVGLAENFVTGLNRVGDALQGEFAASRSQIADFGIEFGPRFAATGRTAGEAFSEEFQAAIQDGVGQNFAANLISDAESRAAARQSAAGAVAGTRTPTAETGSGGGSGNSAGAASALARADAIEQLVGALQRERDALNFTGLEREVFLGKLEAEDALRQALSDSSLGLTDAQIDAQSRLTAVEAANLEQLIRGNAIKAQTQAFDEARGALVGQTIRNLKAEGEAVGLVGTERRVFGEILRAEDQLRQQLRDSDLELTETQINNLARLTDAERDVIRSTIERNVELENQARLLEEIEGPARQLEERIAAANGLYAQGAISLQMYTQTLREANIAQRELRIEAGDGSFADGFIVQLDRMAGKVKSFSSEAGKTFGSFFENVGQGFADTIGQGIFDIDNLGESLKAVARDAVSQLISSFIQLGLQFVANQILSQTLGAAATAASATQAGVLASAWAPAAAAASLATSGANAIPASAGITSTYALTNALSSIGAGFAQGTSFVNGPGTSTSDRVLAALSVGEGVVTAQGNARNPGVVAAMNRGENVMEDNRPRGNTVIQNFNFPPGTDVDSFKRSRRQVSQAAKTELDRV